MKIPVVFAANDSYVPYTGCAIKSLSLWAHTENQYIVYVMYTDMKPESIEMLEGLRTENVEVSCCNIKTYMKGIRNFQSLHLTQETVYRLLIPEIFSQYDKILYLDGDLIIQDDVAKLYKTEIRQCVVGAAHEVRSELIEPHYQNDLGFSCEEAFNAGVLLMNLKQFAKERIKEKCLALLEKDSERSKRKYLYLDQDVLNITCRGKVRFVDDRWNFQAGHLMPDKITAIFDDYKEDYEKTASDCGIIHFTGFEKPWLYPKTAKADAFWEIAEKTIFCEELKQKVRLEKEKRKRGIPYCNFKENADIVLYGAGRKGNELYNRILYDGYCNIVLWVDKNAENMRESNPAVRGIQEIQKTEYDQIVIAIEKEEIVKTVIALLKSYGIEETKIIWAYKRGGQDEGI